MPIPLAMMIPFMATQSMVMGDAFGQAFQYGKRKISAMTNEEFNTTSMEQLASQMFKAYQNIIPDLKQSIEQSRSLQALIVTELLRLPTSIFQEVTGTSGNVESIRKTNPTTGQVNQAFTQSDPWEGWNQFWKSASLLNKAHADSVTTTTSTFNPPEFGDQSPPKVFDKEVNSAQNEIEYKKRIAESEAAARRAALTAAAKTQPTADALRRKAIAESGLSPLAYAAVETFKSNIDTQVKLVETITGNWQASLRSAKLSTGYTASLQDRHAAAEKVKLDAAVKKLGALRIKFQQSYGYHY